MMRLLTEEDISWILRNLTPENARRLLDALSSGLASYSRQQHASEDKKTIHQPLRTMIVTQESNTVLTMPVSDTTSTVVKVATVPAKGDIAGAVTIYNSVGKLLGVLNAAEITAFRTALASMTMLTRWPGPQRPRVCVFGSGKQAEWHVRLALLLVPGIRRVTVINRSKKRLDDLEQGVLSDLKKSYPDVEFEAIAKEGNDAYQQTLNDRLAEADIINGCTPSIEPLFTAKELSGTRLNGRFMSLIGSYKPNMQEIDTETLNIARKAGKIWVDLKDACLEEAGELIRAEVGREDLVEIGEFFADEGEVKTTLETGRELTLFKCVGFGFMDLVISKALLEMAEDLGKGTVIERF